MNNHTFSLKNQHLFLIGTLIFIILISSQLFFANKLAKQLISERTQIDLFYLETGSTPFLWPFDNIIDIKSHGRNSIDKYEIDNGIFSVQPQSGDPYFWLNFNGRLLDLQHYPHFKIRLFSTKEDKLQLHASCSPDNKFLVTNYSRQIPLKPGWQIIKLNLAELKWHNMSGKLEKNLCNGLAISGLRIDPVNFANKFKIDQIALLSAWPASLGVKNAPIFYFNEWLYSPESLQQFTQHIWSQNPSAIVMPDSKHLIAKNKRESSKLDWSMILSVMLVFLALLSLSTYARKQINIRLLIIICATIITFQIVPFFTKSNFLLSLDVASYLVILITILRIDARFGWKEGLGFNTGIQPWLIIGFGTAIFLLFLIALSFSFEITDKLSFETLSKRIYRYLLLAIIQQLLLGPILASILLRLTSNHIITVLATASLFSLFHFPNVPLSAVTFIAGLIWVHVYLRYGTIVPQVISHLLLGSVFLLLVPAFIGGSGEIGFSYFPSIGY